MNLLAIDTALEACSVGIALGSPERVVTRSDPVIRGHAERLFALVDEALAEAGVTLGEIDRFAVTVGPGSFTGIRVGVAAVRGFALVTGVPAIGVTTLAAFAERARVIGRNQPVLSAMPAKGGEAFAQLFSPEGEELMAPAVAKPADLATIAAEAHAAIAGPAADQIVDAAPEAGFVVIHQEAAPDIVAVLSLARQAAEGEAPKPLYVKPPDAIARDDAVARR